MFSNLNRDAKLTTKALNVLFEWWGLFELFCEKNINDVPVRKEVYARKCNP
ncbi:MAG: hypothetical protein PHG06_16670 [Parabacteroides sp.]|nr:hypothetical protein [Parabacteroides sp.]